MRSHYRPDIDGVRAVAVLSVMAYHLDPSLLPGGFVGVDVFFVISGYVVTGSMIQARPPSFCSFISEFYARRLARILPALCLMLVVSAVLATMFIPVAWLSEFSEKTARYAFFGASNVALQGNTDTYFAPRSEMNPYVHTWSLGVEEQFYIIIPFLVYLWVVSMASNRRMVATTALVLMAAASAASAIACIAMSHAAPQWAFYFVGSRFWELAAGSLLCLAPDAVRRLPRVTVGWRNGATAAAGLTCCVLAFGVADARAFPWPWVLLPVAGTLLLVGGVNVSPDDPIRRALAFIPLVWVGKRSYSFYLWHWPVYVLMRWTIGLGGWFSYGVALAITFTAGMLSYRLVEQPFRYGAWIGRQPTLVRVVGFLILPILGLWTVNNIFYQRPRLSLSVVTQSMGDWHGGQTMLPGLADTRACRVAMERHEVAGGWERHLFATDCPGAASRPTLHVLGDSHAEMLIGSLDQWTAESGADVRILSFAGCSFIDFMKPVRNNTTPGCFDFIKGATKRITEAARPGDIVLLPSLRLHRYSSQWASNEVADLSGIMYSPEAMVHRRAALAEARDWLRAFHGKRLQILFMAPLPVFRAPPFRCSDWFNSMNPICIGNHEHARDELERVREPVLSAMRELAVELGNIAIWDPFPSICPGEQCYAFRDGRPMFIDGDHLSAYGNLIIYPSLRDTLKRLQ